MSAAKAGPDLSEVRRRAMSLMEAHRFDEALTLLRQLLAAGQVDWNVWYVAGQCARYLGDLDQAIGYLTEATRRDQDPMGATATYHALGIALQLTERWQDASAAFVRAIEIDPENASSYNSLAITQRKSGQLDKALHNYEVGLTALCRRIAKGLINEPTNPILKHRDTVGFIWMNYVSYTEILLALEAGAQGLAWPTGDFAIKEEQTEEHQGLYWVDTIAENEKTRLFLPNFYNTFREALVNEELYPMMLENRGVVLELLGRQEEADLHFNEAAEFRSMSAKL